MHWKMSCCPLPVSSTNSLPGPIDMILPSACATLSPCETIGPISATAPTQANDRLPMSKNTKMTAAIRGKIDGKNCVFASFKMPPLLIRYILVRIDTYTLYIVVFQVVLQYDEISQNVPLVR